MTKLNLKFVNGGKPFILPNWTVGKHKAVLEEVNKLSKTVSEEDKDVEFQYWCIFIGLEELDPDLQIEQVRNIHPAVLGELFNVVYSEGKCDIYFREKGKKKGSK